MGGAKVLALPLETGELGRILWRGGVGVLLAAAATEFLPVVFGAGEAASWD